MFRLKSWWGSFCYECWRIRGRLIALGVVVVLIVAAVAANGIHSNISATRQEQEAAQRLYQREQEIYQFLNQGNENLLYDFNYLMRALEENWPFFNLSISANGVDVHEVADNVRRILSDPATEDVDTHAFLDFLRENFFWEIGRIGHLWLMWQYQDHFESIRAHNQIVRDMGVTPYNVAAALERHARPQTAMFYETLRDAGGSRLVHPDTLTPRESLSVYETAILEEGRIAYLAVSRMMNITEDPWQPRLNAPRYQALLYEFHGQIEGFGHLIIDMRGNTGGINLHFDAFVVSPLLREQMYFPGYVFYMGGEYSRVARENHDLRMWYTLYQFSPNAATFAESLPYLDTEINLPYAFEVFYSLYPGYIYSNTVSTIREEILFDGAIWMLVDEMTASAAESAVAMLKLNNIATVVGETTYGILGTTFDPTNAVVSLPNTGILVRMDISYFTDIYGRPLQGYGISPHYFNRPGMDALETVLAMIAEIDEG